MTSHQEIFIMNTDLYEVLWLNTNIAYSFIFDIVLRQFFYYVNWVNVELLTHPTESNFITYPSLSHSKTVPINDIKNICVKVNVSP
jgi:hypothetical protein